MIYFPSEVLPDMTFSTRGLSTGTDSSDDKLLQFLSLLDLQLQGAEDDPWN